MRMAVLPLLALIVVLSAFAFTGCSRNLPVQTTPQANTPLTAFTDPNFTETPGNTNSSSEAPGTTPTVIPDTSSQYTITPTFNPGTEFPPISNHDIDYCFGPFYFGDELYYIYADGETVAIFDPFTEIDLLSVKAEIPQNREMFFLSASLIDLNFDGYPDFSYLRNEDGQRECFLSVTDKDGQIVTYERDSTFSTVYHISRCYETKSVYCKLYLEDEYFWVWQKVDDHFTILEETVPDIFEWNAEKIASALFGEGTNVQESDDVTIRGCSCKSVQIFGTLTIAYDEYGEYYIKDMPTSGFCRLSLNPDGRWSKSEKVSA